MIGRTAGFRARKTASSIRWWRGYIVAVAGVAVAALARWGLGHVVSDLPPYTVFYPAVFISALVGGIGPGLLATVLGVLAADLFVIEPLGRLTLPTMGQAVGMGLFLLINVAISILAGRFRRNSEALRESETRLQMAQHAAHVGAFEWNVETGVNTWTPQLEAMYGLKPGEFGGTEAAWEALVHPDDRAKAVAGVDRAFEIGQPQEHEWRVVWPDGSTHWLVGRFQAFKDHNGRPLRLVGVNIDITDRKQAEEAEHQSAQRFRALVTASSYVVYRMSPDWSEMRELHGRDFIPNTEAPSRTWLFKYIDPEDQPHVMAVINEAIRTKKVFALEHRVRRVDGTLGWTLSRAVPLMGPNGEIIEWFGTATDITKRKEAEQALRDSEERLRHFIDSAPVAILMLDNNMRHLAVSRRWLESFDLSLERVVGHNHYEVFPDIPERWKEIHRRCLTGATESCEEDIFDRANGRRQWSRWEIQPWYSAPGVIGGIIIFSEDITKRKNAEEALRRSEEHFRTMVNAIPQLAWMARPDGYLFGFNDRCFEYTGATPEQLEGWAWQSVIHPEVLPKVLERWMRSIETGEPYDMESAIRGADGQYRQFLTRIVPVKDREGRITLWFGTATDISQLQETQEALRQSEELFRQLAENIPQLAWMGNADGAVFWFNKRVFDYTGRTLEELSGWKWKTVLHPADTARVSEEIKKAFAGEEPWEDTFVIRGHTGEYRWFLSRAFPLLDKEGKVTRWFGTSTDISDIVAAREVVAQDRDKLERKVAERTAKLRETVGELEHMSYSMVHDMRAPLRAMQAFAQMLHEDCADCRRPPGSDYINHIRDASIRLDALITDALNYNKVVRETPSVVPVDLGKLLRGMLQTYPAFHPPAADVSLEFEELFVLGNESLLTQCFSNLLDNAVKFVARGVHPRVRIWTEPGDQQSVRVFVQDNGIGIPKDAQEKIFGMFERMHHQSEYPGTGIGLTIARKAVGRMGGHIDMESEPGKGTCFCVELPTPDSPERNRLREADLAHPI